MDEKIARIIISTHVDSTGPSQNFLEFCKINKIREVLFIGHPLTYQENQKGSCWQYYTDGLLKNEHYLQNKKRSYVLNYFKDIALNLFWVMKSKGKWDIYVGSDNLNAFCGIILKWFGKVDKVVYYTIDFVPHRFENKILDKIYHWLDLFCVKHSVITWNLSPRMTEGREEYFKFSKKYREKQTLVPEGIWFERISRVPFGEIKKNSMVFVGHLVPRLGVQKALEAVPEIIRSIPDFKFIIIGKGAYRKELEKLAKDLNIEKYVEFKGFVLDHRDVEKIIAGCAVGIAPYSDKERTFSYFCDPSKTKVYMGCGIPVVMTDIFYNAQEIEESGAGKIVRYDAGDIAKVVIELMSDEEKLKKYKENATNYAKNLDWQIVFKDALKTQQNK